MVQHVVFAVAPAFESAGGILKFPDKMLPADFQVSQLGSVSELCMVCTYENEGHRIFHTSSHDLNAVLENIIVILHTGTGTAMAPRVSSTSQRQTPMLRGWPHDNGADRPPLDVIANYIDRTNCTQVFMP